MLINEEISTDQSIILRYAQGSQSIDYSLLKKVSLQEGARLCPIAEYKGVDLWLLDLSSVSQTHTFKASLGCITIAHCLKNNIGRIVLQSSGNTGNALAAYAIQHDLQMLLFYPEASRYKIDPALFDNKKIFAIECQVSEPKLKQIVAYFSEKYSIELMPTYELQIEANKARAYYILEHYLKTKQWFDWHSQAISTGYGVFGMYHGFEELKKSGHFPKELDLPKLLAIQQASVQPYVQNILNQDDSVIQDKTISPTLFRTKPSDHEIEKMRAIIALSKGQLKAITYDHYTSYKQQAIELLLSIDINLGLKIIGGAATLVEETGLLSLVGSLIAINQGLIAQGSSLLVTFTGGAKNLTSQYAPKYTLYEENLEEQLALLADTLAIPQRINPK